MPNWCEGDITIYSNEPEVLRKIVEQASQGTHEVGSDWDRETRQYKNIQQVPNVFSFENFLPTPPEELEEGGDWYSWRVDNWGTKWDLNQENLAFTPIQRTIDPDAKFTHEFNLMVQTAWSPAIPIFQKIAEEFDVFVEYKFIEEGMAFFGVVTMDKEGIVKEDVREPSTEDYVRAGCVLDENGDIDWENTDEYDLFLALDYWEEYDYEQSN